MSKGDTILQVLMFVSVLLQTACSSFNTFLLFFLTQQCAKVKYFGFNRTVKITPCIILLDTINKDCDKRTHSTYQFH
jgi:hypothetical protein